MTLRVNSEPRTVDRLPFASESGLQRFVKEHAKDLLGLNVVAVAERGGGMISKIDVMAIDRSGQPWIIECKHDLVNHRAVDQLRRYRSVILRRWPTIRKIIAARFGSIRLQNHPQPRLLTIGYRYDPRVIEAEGLTRLAYRYHGIGFSTERFQTRTPGHVSLHHVEDIPLPIRRHPRIWKKDGTLSRLSSLDPATVSSFQDIHVALNGLTDVDVTYNKNLIRYRTPKRVFATAAIQPEGVEWRLRGGAIVRLRPTTDLPELLNALRKALERAG